MLVEVRIAIAFSSLAMLLSSLGCGPSLTRNTTERTRFLELVEPVRAAKYVEIAGLTYGEDFEQAQPFLLLMGPRGKAFFRTPRLACFSDGKRVGTLDYEKTPPLIVFRPPGEDVAADIYMGIAHAGGPAVWVLARLVDQDTWLSHLVGDDERAVFEERRLADDRTEFRIRYGVLQDEHRFVFSGPRLAPEFYGCYPRGQTKASMWVRFGKVAYPESIPATNFVPSAKRFGPKMETPGE